MINGIHHVTALSSTPQKNVDFYSGVLGLRLVKQTVNFDDPGVYHLYYGDGLGSPGTIITFFPYGRILPGQHGTGETHSVAFSVPQGSLDDWKTRLEQNEVGRVEESVRFGSRTLTIKDPDGMIIDLTEEPVENRPAIDWPEAPLEPSMAIRRIIGVTLAPGGHGPIGEFTTTEDALERMLGFVKVGEEDNRTRYQTGESFVDVVRDPLMPPMRSSAGTIHHVAFRNPDDASQQEWQLKLVAAGFRVSPVMDRNYFHSIYFREPGGVLFEFATDAPGFDADEPRETLGESLKLPAQYESRRSMLEKTLEPLTLPYPKGGRLAGVAQGEENA